ncbi:hypothetical protein [Rhodohalobacter barkolensis]|uniref:Uncharacterized protein n=1 Tax=Rhodohalobacter barkolensis TaxID=2053187 RepID=A0A2N0VH07_9BACT|nr:hypothetical protein [Rhodohalobacter barkolensis]PKD43461.1 hypothetical protein CWD77_07775 [Rhodohalobacter barkolensis]
MKYIYISGFYISILFLSFSLTGCSKTETDNTVQETEAVPINKFEETATGDSFIVKFKYDDGQENEKIANALVTIDVFDDLGFSEGEVLSLIRLSIIRSQYELNYPRSFKLSEKDNAVFVSTDDDGLSILIRAIGANAMGVESTITVIDKYDKQGEHIEMFSM